MKDKVTELRKILEKKKASEQKTQPFEDGDPGAVDSSQFTVHSSADGKQVNEDSLFGGAESEELAQLKKQMEELKKANEMQKDMYLRQVAETENFKKRLQREHDEFVKFALEKFLNEVLPVIDGLESTLDHASKDDPIFEGVSLTLKQFLQVLEKFGVQQISGVGQAFDPHTQEAIGTQKDESIGSDNVVTVHRKGYVLNGKVLRAALVTVGE